MKNVFLGGTCESSWREELIPVLKIDYFDPVVDDWTEGARAEEKRQRKACDFCLYVITPQMKGVFAIAEAVHDSIKRPYNTMFCVLEEYKGETFDKAQEMSLLAVSNMIEENGAKVFTSLEDIAAELNKHYVKIPFNAHVVECLIVRDGPTEVTLQTDRYLFERNELGDCVCEVHNADHRKYLCGLPDFRIYQEDKLPKPEFTKEETAFIQQWRTMNAERFLAYVNGRFERFVEAGPKVRKIAAEKWKTLLPDQPCPFRIEEEANERTEEVNERTVTEDDRKFVKEWLRLNAKSFKKYLLENEARFFNAPDSVFDKAEEKWRRMIPDEPFPYPVDEAS